MHNTVKKNITDLIKYMSKDIYEKEHIVAMALLCSLAGENMFLLGPPGTAKSMVAARLKLAFNDATYFEYLMSRFSTHDEIFGPVSISKLKNEDKYQRLTEGYLPQAHVVFLDEIWKAGPSIQNTLLTVINEHIFYNGCEKVKTPLKALIAASNELPAKDEGLEALWDRFLVRMVSNCIESDASFFKMLKSKDSPLDIPKSLCITDAKYNKWQTEASDVTLGAMVEKAIKVLRKNLSTLEKDDSGQLRYYVSDRRWRKIYKLMQMSAYLNGRRQIALSDYLVLIHCLWNDVETIPQTIKALVDSITAPTLKALEKLDRAIKSAMATPKDNSATTRHKSDGDFQEFDYFYYLLENYPDSGTYFSKWDYSTLTETNRDAIKYFDTKRERHIIHALIPGQQFENKFPNWSDLTKVTVRKCAGGVVIDGVPYKFRRKGDNTDLDFEHEMPVYQKINEIQAMFKSIVNNWETMINELQACDNIFLSDSDIALVLSKNGEVVELIKATEVKLNNVLMMMKR